MNIANALEKLSALLKRQYTAERAKHRIGFDTVKFKYVYKQLNTYACGSCAVMTVIKHFYPERKAKDIYDNVGALPGEGAGTARLCYVLKESGIQIQNYKKALTFSKLADAVAEGKPVIVCIGNCSDDSHWVVLYGTNRYSGQVLLAGLFRFPWHSSCGVMDYIDFKKIWFTRGSGMVCSRA